MELKKESKKRRKSVSKQFSPDQEKQEKALYKLFLSCFNLAREFAPLKENVDQLVRAFQDQDENLGLEALRQLAQWTHEDHMLPIIMACAFMPEESIDAVKRQQLDSWFKGPVSFIKLVGSASQDPEKLKQFYLLLQNTVRSGKGESSNLAQVFSEECSKINQVIRPYLKSGITPEVQVAAAPVLPDAMTPARAAIPELALSAPASIGGQQAGSLSEPQSSQLPSRDFYSSFSEMTEVKQEPSALMALRESFVYFYSFINHWQYEQHDAGKVAIKNLQHHLNVVLQHLFIPGGESRCISSLKKILTYIEDNENFLLNACGVQITGAPSFQFENLAALDEKQRLEAAKPMAFMLYLLKRGIPLQDKYKLLKQMVLALPLEKHDYLCVTSHLKERSGEITSVRGLVFNNSAVLGKRLAGSWKVHSEQDHGGGVKLTDQGYANFFRESMVGNGINGGRFSIPFNIWSDASLDLVTQKKSLRDELNRRRDQLWAAIEGGSLPDTQSHVAADAETIIETPMQSLEEKLGFLVFQAGLRRATLKARESGALFDPSPARMEQWGREGEREFIQEAFVSNLYGENTSHYLHIACMELRHRDLIQTLNLSPRPPQASLNSSGENQEAPRSSGPS